jgi:hypothetical protein
MKLKRHELDSLHAELKQQGLHERTFPKHLPCSIPSQSSRVAQTTAMFRCGNEHLLFLDDHGAFLNQRIFSPYECVFIDDLPYLRPKILGSISLHIPLKTLTAFLIHSDIIRTYADVESVMVLEQVHSKLIQVHGYYVYHTQERHLVRFGFTVTTDKFNHVTVCRHSIPAA